MINEIFWKPDFVILGMRDPDGKNVSIVAARGEEIISGLVREERTYDELRTWANDVCRYIQTDRRFTFETVVSEFVMIRGKTFSATLKSLFRRGKS